MPRADQDAGLSSVRVPRRSYSRMARPWDAEPAVHGQQQHEGAHHQSGRSEDEPVWRSASVARSRRYLGCSDELPVGFGERCALTCSLRRTHCTGHIREKIGDLERLGQARLNAKLP